MPDLFAEEAVVGSVGGEQLPEPRLDRPIDGVTGVPSALVSTRSVSLLKWWSEIWSAASASRWASASSVVTTPEHDTAVRS